MIKNAEVEPENPRNEGRGGVEEYNTKGYISTVTERSGTRTFEYAYCDYAIATVAKKLGKQDVYEKYLERSNNWKTCGTTTSIVLDSKDSCGRKW